MRMDKEEPASRFERGDHVYQWCKFAGLPNVYQHHGIVVDVERIPGTKEERLTICDFSNFLPSSPKQNEVPGEPTKQKKNKVMDQIYGSLVGGGGTESTGGAFRVYKTTTASKKSWHKVEYGATTWRTMFSRSGICTTMEATDSPDVVLNRVNFLLEQTKRDATNGAFVSTVLPKYHLLLANCECVAMWCKTGQWSTLQGASFLTGAAFGGPSLAVGQSKGVLAMGTAAEVAATSQGRMAVLSAGPSLFRRARRQPAMAAAGAIVVGASAVTLELVRSKWNATTTELNEAFSEGRCQTPASRTCREWRSRV